MSSSLDVELSGSTSSADTTCLTVPPEKTCPACSAASQPPCLTHATCLSLKHKQMAIPNDENTASRIQTIHEVRITAMRATLKQLGIEVEEKILAKLVEGYDGVMPMERYLAENGYWVPLAPADGREGEGFGDGSA